LTLTGVEFAPLGYKLFNLTTGDVVSEVDLTTILEPHKEVVVGSPTESGEYVYVVSLRINELELSRIDYAFKIIVDNEPDTQSVTQMPDNYLSESTLSEEMTETTAEVITETATEVITETTITFEELIDTNMPNPFPQGSDDNVSYYQPGNHILDNVTVSLLRLVDQDEQNEWHESLDFFNNPPSSLTEYFNLYSFIKKFDISDEEVIEAMSAHLTSDNWQTRVTEEELDLILHGSEAEIVSYFASDYSIVVGDKIYCPYWVYTHTPTAYKQAGITPEALQQKLDLYADIRLSPEALSALNEKINSYINS
jgi:hypothetical protein